MCNFKYIFAIVCVAILLPKYLHILDWEKKNKKQTMREFLHCWILLANIKSKKVRVRVFSKA